MIGDSTINNDSCIIDENKNCSSINDCMNINSCSFKNNKNSGFNFSSMIPIIIVIIIFILFFCNNKNQC